MKLKFNGQTHSIDANTLINVLTHYQNIVVEANRLMGGGEKTVSVQVNAISEGSFVIDVLLVQNLIEQLFSRERVEYAANLTECIGGVFALYKIFKGKPAKDKNLTVNFKAETINIYNQPPIRQAISKSIETADNDCAVEGFEVSFDDVAVPTSFDKSEFKDYIYDDFENEEDIPDERYIEEKATLTIVGLNFEKGSRWQFIYQGFKIPIIVKDDALMKKIDEGARFGKGDAIKVKLRIIQRYNREYKAYENKSYKIIEFYEHLVAPKEQHIFE